MATDRVYLGTRGIVAAISTEDGSILWEMKLREGIFNAGDSFVTLLALEDRILAHTSGELFCLDAETGDLLWHNELEGFGYYLASLAIPGKQSAPPDAVERLHQMRRQNSSS